MSYRLPPGAKLQMGQVIYEVTGSNVIPYVAVSATNAQRWEDDSILVSVAEFGGRIFFADESTALNFLFDVKTTQAKSAQQEADKILQQIQRSGVTLKHARGSLDVATKAILKENTHTSDKIIETPVHFDPFVSLSRGELGAQLVRADGSVLLATEPKWGFGKDSQGGAATDGDFYLVDTLEDTSDDTSGSEFQGSLRRGIESATKPRTIRFLVRGNIVLKRPLHLRSRLSILGPEFGFPGVRIVGDSVFAIGSKEDNKPLEHIIIKNIGFRNGGVQPINGSFDQSDSFEALFCNNVFIDRCSFAWSVDECCSLTDCDNCTIQRSIIAYSLKNAHHSKGAHALAGLYSGNGISLVANLFAHHQFRPNIIGGAQVAKCVFYNYEGKNYPVNIYTTESHQSTECDLEECEFRAGPSTHATEFRMVRIDGDFVGTQRADNRPDRIKRLWHERNMYHFRNGSTQPLLDARIRLARPDVNYDGGGPEGPSGNFNIFKTDAKFPLLRDPDIFLDSVDPATQAGAKIPDNLDLRVREDYATGLIVGPARTDLIDRPEDVIANGFAGL